MANVLNTDLLNLKKLQKALDPKDMLLPLAILVGITFFLRNNVVDTLLVGLNAILMMGLIQTAGGKLTNFNVVGFFLLQGPIFTLLSNNVPQLNPVPVWLLGAVSTAVMVKILFAKVDLKDSFLIGVLQEAIFYAFSFMLAQGLLDSMMTVIPI